MTDIGVTGGGNGTHMIYIDGKKNNVVKNIDLEDYRKMIEVNLRNQLGK